MKVRNKDYWFIGKVQVSISGKPSTLIYNHNKRWWYQCDRKFGENLLGNRLKAYFRMCHRIDGTLYVDKEVKKKYW